jgi:hypothetical protein
MPLLLQPVLPDLQILPAISFLNSLTPTNFMFLPPLTPPSPPKSGERGRVRRKF